MIGIHRLLFAALALTLVVGACRRNPEPAPAPTTTPDADSIARERARSDSIARAEQARRDSIAAADRARAESEAAITRTRQAIMAPIYFDFDSDALSSAATASLDQKLAIMNANPNLRIRVSGHADERGSDEYNLALGQRRAAAAKRYLVQRGVADARIDIISYGEERPAVQGSDESSWSQNRRDEFEITSGGDQLTPAGGV